jgi:hypothetical protein
LESATFNSDGPHAEKDDDHGEPSVRSVVFCSPEDPYEEKVDETMSVEAIHGEANQSEARACSSGRKGHLFSRTTPQNKAVNDEPFDRRKGPPYAMIRQLWPNRARKDRSKQKDHVDGVSR